MRPLARRTAIRPYLAAAEGIGIRARIAAIDRRAVAFMSRVPLKKQTLAEDRLPGRLMLVRIDAEREAPSQRRRAAIAEQDRRERVASGRTAIATRISGIGYLRQG